MPRGSCFVRGGLQFPRDASIISPTCCSKYSRRVQEHPKANRGEEPVGAINAPRAPADRPRPQTPSTSTRSPDMPHAAPHDLAITKLVDATSPAVAPEVDNEFLLFVGALGTMRIALAGVAGRLSGKDRAARCPTRRCARRVIQVGRRQVQLSNRTGWTLALCNFEQQGARISGSRAE
jgi:hypothetical protein